MNRRTGDGICQICGGTVKYSEWHTKTDRKNRASCRACAWSEVKSIPNKQKSLSSSDITSKPHKKARDHKKKYTKQMSLYEKQKLRLKIEMELIRNWKVVR